MAVIPAPSTTDIILTPAGVAATDTANMDAAVTLAKSSKRRIFLTAGTYVRSTAWDLRANNLCVTGSGQEVTLIQPPANTAGVLLGGWRQNIEAFGVKYSAQQAAANTNAVAFSFYKCAWSTYSRLTAYLSNVGFDTPQVDYDDGDTSTGNYGMFSCNVEDIYVSGYTVRGFRLKGYNQGFTQNTMRNIYIKNNYTGSIASSSDSAFIIDNGDDVVINGLNLEWSSHPTSHVMLVQTCRSAVINALHFEQVGADWFNGALINIYDRAKLTVNAFSVVWSRFNSGGGAKSVILSGDGCKTLVNGLELHDNTVTGTFTPYRAQETGGTAEARFLNGDAPTSPFTTASNNDTTAVPTLKQINDIVYASRNAAGKHVLTGTAAPSTGTWAVGDTVWNSAPAAAGTPGWVCTTAGTPGTWKAMASVAA